LILADEPTGNLDQRTGEGIVSAMFELARDSGAALVLVTHDSRLADRYDRRVEIEAGHIRSDRRIKGTSQDQEGHRAGVSARAN
jgi:putative ABC transport system ATP-binding protein